MFTCPLNLDPNWSYPWTCGHCPACKAKKRREWTSRMINEAYTSQYCWFLTLTYENKHIFYSMSDDGVGLPSLKPQDLKQFSKNLQKLGKYRYFSVGEYGDQTERPHYHMIIFSNDPKFSDPFELEKKCRQKWGKGFVTLREANHDRFAYTARYTIKKLTKATDPALQGRHPEFSRMSRNPGLGCDFAKQVARNYLTASGSKFIAQHGDVLPVYRYKNKEWPLGKYILGKIREELGIPLKLDERLEINPNADKLHKLPEHVMSDLPPELLMEKLYASEKKREHKSRSIEATRNRV